MLKNCSQLLCSFALWVCFPTPQLHQRNQPDPVYINNGTACTHHLFWVFNKRSIVANKWFAVRCYSGRRRRRSCPADDDDDDVVHICSIIKLLLLYGAAVYEYMHTMLFGAGVADVSHENIKQRRKERFAFISTRNDNFLDKLCGTWWNERKKKRKW